MRPDSHPRLWRYINLLLTYLLISVLSKPEYARPVVQPDYSLPPPARSSPPITGEKSTKALELKLQLEFRRIIECCWNTVVVAM